MRERFLPASTTPIASQEGVSRYLNIEVHDRQLAKGEGVGLAVADDTPVIYRIRHKSCRENERRVVWQPPEVTISQKRS